MDNHNKFYDLQSKVIQWGTDRNFYGEGGTTPQKQFLKLIEEFGELSGGVARGNKEMIKDAIGDCIVVLFGMARLVQKEDAPYKPLLYQPNIFNEPIHEKLQGACYDMFTLTFTNSDVNTINVIINNLMEIEKQYGFYYAECLEHAYNEIKDRKGSMVDGVYVKEADYTQN